MLITFPDPAYLNIEFNSDDNCRKFVEEELIDEIPVESIEFINDNNIRVSIIFEKQVLSIWRKYYQNPNQLKLFKSAKQKIDIDELLKTLKEIQGDGFQILSVDELMKFIKSIIVKN